MQKQDVLQYQEYVIRKIMSREYWKLRKLDLGNTPEEDKTILKPLLSF
jgi:hypothetical protein